MQSMESQHLGPGPGPWLAPVDQCQPAALKHDKNMTKQPCGANHTSRSREFGRLQDVLRAVGSSTLALLYSAYFTSRGIQRTGRARSSLLDDQAFGCLFQKQVTCSTTSGDFTKAAHTFPILPESCGDRITELSITERSLSRNVESRTRLSRAARRSRPRSRSRTCTSRRRLDVSELRAHRPL